MNDDFGNVDSLPSDQFAKLREAVEKRVRRMEHREELLQVADSVSAQWVDFPEVEPELKYVIPLIANELNHCAKKIETIVDQFIPAESEVTP